MTFHARLEATMVGLLYTVLLVVTSINCAVVNETAVSLGSTIHLPCAVADDANDEANHVIANNQVTCNNKELTFTRSGHNRHKFAKMDSGHPIFSLSHPIKK